MKPSSEAPLLTTLYTARCAHVEAKNIRASRKEVLSMAEAAAVSPPDLRRAACHGLAEYFDLVVVISGGLQAAPDPSGPLGAASVLFAEAS